MNVVIETGRVDDGDSGTGTDSSGDSDSGTTGGASTTDGSGGSGGTGGTGSFTVGDGGSGGAAVGSALHARGALELFNVTFARNSGTNGLGGASGNGRGGRSGGDGLLAGSCAAADPGAVVRVANSILASSDFGTVYGPVLDAGHNLFTDGGTGTPGPGSLRNSD
ncbi:MAG: hypothetical protein KC486_01670, partial [Myxococcales bacterium]|nr:hypothetical protein [Myxococcales bacterium]